MVFSTNVNSHSFQIPFDGKIRDPIHDSITYTTFEKKIIDTPYFQRLRRIKQTAFIQYVFPGGTHTRFEHSLGVMHVAGLVYFALLNNQKKMIQGCPEFLETEQAYFYLKNEFYLFQCFRFAALLHDVGHSALSHSGERFMVPRKVFLKEINSLKISPWLKNGFKNKFEKEILQSSDLENLQIRHEVYSLMCVDALFQNENELYLSSQMAQDICSVLDSNIHPFPGGILESTHLRTLFHEIISGEIDVDRMDYLLRDSKQCGVVYGYYDLARLLDSIGFYKNIQNDSYHLAIRKSGVPTFEDFLRARLSMYNQVYFHKTATACESMLEHLKRQFSEEKYFSLDLEKYFSMDDHNIYLFLENKISDNNGSQNNHQLVQDLMFNRVLWKRIYEEFIPKNSSRKIPSLCPAIQKILLKNGIPCEIIESSTNLTRFSPKGRSGKSANHFQVILKDFENNRSLEPIENHSTLMNSLEEDVIIKRIFISNTKFDGSSVDFGEIQKEIFEIVSHVK